MPVFLSLKKHPDKQIRVDFNSKLHFQPCRTPGGDALSEDTQNPILPCCGIPGFVLEGFLSLPEGFPLHVLVGDAVVHQGLVPHRVPGVAQRLRPQLVRLWGQTNTEELQPRILPCPNSSFTSGTSGGLVRQQLQGSIKVGFCKGAR